MPFHTERFPKADYHCYLGQVSVFQDTALFLFSLFWGFLFVCFHKEQDIPLHGPLYISPTAPRLAPLQDFTQIWNPPRRWDDS